ncbi:hypothetical protein [Sinorhizobium fredii]|uniref:hypothetical protein n=1 Tax=Rhizobium fredii TaxID=380 RepID=UPI0004B714C6|nr:hypothetical protein [Sinorhizobium fredii]AWI55908.1 hypothetical protein AB395_0000224 [Sinorhizobium fredii CCBAU 45436]
MLKTNGASVFDNRQVQHESELEQQVSAVIQARHGIVEVRSQFPKVTYVDPEGRVREHIFDYWARFKNGFRLAIAVKYESEKAELRPVLAGVQKKHRPLFDDMRIMTERHATKDDFRNAKTILWSREFHNEDHVRTLLGELHGQRGSQIQFFQLYAPHVERTDRTIAIWRLIDLQVLKPVQHGRVNELTWFTVNL